MIDYISRVNIDDKYIEKISNYNYVLAKIIKTLNKCNYSSRNSGVTKDIFLNIVVYVYFNLSVVNYDYDFLIYVYDYITNNTMEIVKSIGYNLENIDIHNENFIENFNRANSFLVYLYNEKYNNSDKEKSGLIKLKKFNKNNTPKND